MFTLCNYVQIDNLLYHISLDGILNILDLNSLSIIDSLSYQSSLPVGGGITYDFMGFFGCLVHNTSHLFYIDSIYPIQIYSIKLKNWIIFGNQTIMNVSVTRMSCNLIKNKIWTFGGYNIQLLQTMKTIQYFDLQYKTWNIIESIFDSRSYHISFYVSANDNNQHDNNNQHEYIMITQGINGNLSIEYSQTRIFDIYTQKMINQQLNSDIPEPFWGANYWININNVQHCLDDNYSSNDNKNDNISDIIIVGGGNYDGNNQFLWSIFISK